MLRQQSKLPLMKCLLSARSMMLVIAALWLLQKLWYISSVLVFQIISWQQPISPPDAIILPSAIKASEHIDAVCPYNWFNLVPVFTQNILITPFFVPTAILFDYKLKIHNAVYEVSSSFVRRLSVIVRVGSRVRDGDGLKVWGFGVFGLCFLFVALLLKVSLLVGIILDFV